MTLNSYPDCLGPGKNFNLCTTTSFSSQGAGNIH